MKNNALWTVLIILITQCGFSKDDVRVVDRIYAQVNEDIITLSDINRRLDAVRGEYEAKLSGKELEQAMAEAKDNILEALIEEKLLVQKAIELGLDADVEPKVSSEIQQIMKENNINTMEEFEDILERQNTNLRDYRELIRNRIIIIATYV